MNCQEVRSKLSAYLDGQIQFEDAEAMREHLRTCSGCVDELEQLRGVTVLLCDAEEVEPPAFLLQQIERATVGRKKTTSKRISLRMLWPAPRVAKWAAAVILVASAMVGGLISHHDGQRLAVPIAATRPAVSPRIAAHAPSAVHPSVTIVAKTLPKPVVAEVAKRVQPTHSRFHRRHRSPKGDLYGGTTAPKLAPIPKDEAAVKPSDEDESRSTATGPEPSTGSSTDKDAGGVRVAAAITSGDLKSERETTALDELRSTIAAKNRQKRHYTYSESVTGDKYSVGIASIKF